MQGIKGDCWALVPDMTHAKHQLSIYLFPTWNCLLNNTDDLKKNPEMFPFNFGQPESV